MLNALPPFQCDLNAIFGGLASRVPDGPPGYGEFVLHQQILPVPPVSLSSDRIVIGKAEHHYNSCYRADGLWMFLSGRTCRELGLFLLSCGFHGPAQTTTLALSHPESDIRRIVVTADEVTLADPPTGLSMKPFALYYFVAENSIATDAQWRARDTVWIEEFSRGQFRFAELLLNAGCCWNTVREYSMEGDAGYR